MQNNIRMLIIILMMIFMTSCTSVIEKTEPLVMDENLSIEEDFPIKPIRIVVPYAAGGGTDGIARAIAESAKNYFSQPIVVTNKLGKGGSRGLTEGILADSDGYTVTLITVEINTLAVLDFINFDYRDLEVLMLLNSEPGVVMVSKDFPYDSVEELITYVHETGTIFSVGSSGEGSIWNLAAIGIEDETSMTFDHIYYDGTALAVMDVLGKNLDIVIAGLSEVSTHLDNNQVKILTVLADERLTKLPDVKTFKESGYDFSIGTWRGLALPKNVHPEIKIKLIEGFSKAANDPKFIEMINTLNLNYDFKNTNEFESFIEEDYHFFETLNRK